MKLRYCVKPLTSSKRPAISECFDGSLHVRSQTVRRLSLAYALHEPQDRQTATDQHPIIILHGLFGSKQNNRSISKAIARDLGTRVYALDLRNHGESPHHPVHDYMSMADDVQEFIQEHSLQKPTLIGHSMGAKAAMTVALRSPDKVRSLIPVDNAPVDALLQSDFAKYVQGMKKIVEAEVTKQVEADKILTTFEPALPIRQFLLTNLIRNSATGKLGFRIPIHTLGAALDNMGDFPYKDPELVRYQGPTLVVRGTKSRYVADEVLPLLGRFFPKFELRDIDSGHWVISEQPVVFKEAVVDFIRNKD